MIVLNKFPTHIAKTKNKFAANKYWKINSQGIYNGAIQRFTRAIIMDNIHKYIISELSSQKLPEVVNPVQLQLAIHIPINYATVRRNKDGTISWKEPNENYRPTNDEDNITWIWTKAIKDCLTKLKVWEDDNLNYCRGVNSMIHFIDNLEDRKIEINFKKL